MRSGYTDDGDKLNLWRASVDRSINGRRGQEFLRRLVVALDQVPDKKLIQESLQGENRTVCTLGAYGLEFGIEMANLDPEDHAHLSKVFGISKAMIAEIEFLNDDQDCGYGPMLNRTPEQRWTDMRAWAVANIKESKP